MDNNSTNLLINLLIDNWRSILGGLGFVIALFLGVVGFVVRHFWNDLKDLKASFKNLEITGFKNLEMKIVELTTRLDTLENKKGLHGQMKEIHDDFIDKLRQQANDLYNSTKAQLHHLATDIAQQQTQVHTSLQVLKTQEASSVAVLTARAQQLVQQFQVIEQGVQQLRSTTEAESARLMAEIGQQRARVKQEIEQMSTRLASLEGQVEKLNEARRWWNQLDKQWQAIFKGAIYIGSEPTEYELVRILSLTNLYCANKELTSLEPLRALTGLRTLNCSNNQLTSLEPLHGLRNLDKLDCMYNRSLSSQEIERFKKTASSSCEVKSGTL